MTDEYEEHGKLIYDHLRYWVATVNPETYIPAGTRENYLQALAAQKQESAGMTADQLLNEFVAEGVLNQNEFTLFTGLQQTISGLADGPNLTFGQVWYAIRNWETATLNNNLIPADDKNLPLLTASDLRNLVKYEYESGQVAEDRGHGCFLGRKTSCWEKKVKKAVLDAIRAAAIAYFSSQSGGGDSGGGTDWGAAKKMFFKVGGIGLVIELIDLYLDSDCRCDAPTPGPTCAKARGISIFPGDCNPLEQVFKAWGYTAPAGTVFNWVVEGGVFPANNNSTSITTISPEVRVRQNDPNIPIRLAVSLSCDQTATTTTEPMSIPFLVNDPGTLMIWGQNEVNSGSYQYKYEFWGTWLNSQNAVIIYSGCTPHGQVTESGINYVKVQWLSTQPAYPTPKVTAIVKNLCSNQTLTQNLNVKVY